MLDPIPDPHDDNWLDTDPESIDSVVDSENVILMQKMIYKLARERNERQIEGFGQGWDACADSFHRNEALRPTG